MCIEKRKNIFHWLPYILSIFLGVYGCYRKQISVLLDQTSHQANFCFFAIFEILIRKYIKKLNVSRKKSNLVNVAGRLRLPNQKLSTDHIRGDALSCKKNIYLSFLTVFQPNLGSISSVFSSARYTTLV